ncbi:MAG: pyruvate formate-lyase-activating protein [Dermatophilaceae bacterium]
MPDYRLRDGTGSTAPQVASSTAYLDPADGQVTGFIHSSETTGTVNGPGVRYTLYMSGCPLRCLYCHNPDTWEMRMGERVTVGQVVADIEEYLVFLRTTHGGLTTSGGEPLLQPHFLLALYRRVKQLWDLHTVLDTSGNLGERATDELLDLTDLVLLDVKSGLADTYRTVTGAELTPTLDFGRRLAARGNRMWIRYVLVPGYTDAPDNLAAVAEYVASLGDPVERVEILPYHSLGSHKYAELGLPYPLDGVPEPTLEQVQSARAVFTAEGLVVR